MSDALGEHVTDSGTKIPIDPIVEGTLSWSLMVESDIAQVVELRLARDYFFSPFDNDGYDELLSRWHDPIQDAGRNAVVGRDRGGTIVAYAWNRLDTSDSNRPRIWIDGGTHPAVRHLDLDQKRMAWQLERAALWLQEPQNSWTEKIYCVRHINLSNDMAQEGAYAVGMVPVRWYLDMIIDVNKYRPTNHTLPAGIELIRWDESYSEETRKAHNLAFATRRGAHEVDENNWVASYSRPDSRPEWSWLAVKDQKVVGYAINSVVEPETSPAFGGWTDMLGVIPQYRSLGLAKALLGASIESFIQAGCSWGGLGVDTEDPEGAEESYSSIGYHRDDGVVLFERKLTKQMGAHLGLLE